MWIEDIRFTMTLVVIKKILIKPLGTFGNPKLAVGPRETPP